MFIKNAWYVAAEPQEVAAGKSLARTILNEKIVIYRTSKGQAFAFADSCPHRFAALSGGKIIDDCIRCPYHGATYDHTGKCVKVPGQTGDFGMAVGLKQYPLVERYNYLWIWMGDPALSSDESGIPEWFGPANPDNPEWKGRHNKILSMPAYYELICDNLHDITHTEFVHPETLGAELLPRLYRMAKGETNEHMRMERSVSKHSIRNDFYLTDVQAGPTFHQMLAFKYGKKSWDENLDWTLTVQYATPTFFVFNPRTKPVGADPSEAIDFCNLNAITPETDVSSHYFFYTAHNLKSTPEREAAFTAFVADSINFAFHQDELLISEQMKRVPNFGHDLESMTGVSFMGDMPQILGRNMIRDKIAAEKVAGRPNSED